MIFVSKQSYLAFLPLCLSLSVMGCTNRTGPVSAGDDGDEDDLGYVDDMGYVDDEDEDEGLPTFRCQVICQAPDGSVMGGSLDNLFDYEAVDVGLATFACDLDAEEGDPELAAACTGGAQPAFCSCDEPDAFEPTANDG